MKKILSLLLSAVICISVFTAVDFSAYAKASICTYFEINPSGVDEETKEELIEKAEEDLNVYSSSASSYEISSTIAAPQKSASYPTSLDAAMTLRDNMVKRIADISVTFLSGDINSDKAMMSVFNKAVDQKYSVSNQDGDYLKYNCGAASVSGSRQYVSGKYLYRLTYHFDYFTTYAQEQQVTKKVAEVFKELNISEKSDYKKALAIHDYVCQTINYDYAHYGDYDYMPQFCTYQGLFNGVAVCQSYATLYYRLAYEADLQCRVVASDDHAWNLVKIKDLNYYVDCTWDDTIYDKMQGTPESRWSNRYGDKYFLVGSETMSDSSHILESQYKTEEFKAEYPTSETDFVCEHEVSVWAVPENSNCEAGFERNLECEMCGFVTGSGEVPLGSSHSYTEIYAEPTCTTGGYVLHQCTVCADNFKTDETNALGHSYKTTVTKATTSKAGSTVVKCTRCQSVKSNIAIPKISSAALSTTVYVYNGNVKTPSVTVKDSKGKVLKKNTDYTVSYASGRKVVGKYAVKITFKGNYSGTKTLYFYVKPKGTEISSISARSKGFRVSWKTQKTQTTGYQIQYSTSSKFTNAKTITVTKNSNYAKLVSKLYARKKYYVRIRTYKNVKIDGKTQKLCSTWSKVKTVTTKK